MPNSFLFKLRIQLFFLQSSVLPLDGAKSVDTGPLKRDSKVDHFCTTGLDEGQAFVSVCLLNMWSLIWFPQEKLPVQLPPTSAKWFIQLQRKSLTEPWPRMHTAPSSSHCDALNSQKTKVGGVGKKEKALKSSLSGCVYSSADQNVFLKLFASDVSCESCCRFRTLTFLGSLQTIPAGVQAICSTHLLHTFETKHQDLFI